jgi:hypothetical protein
MRHTGSGQHYTKHRPILAISCPQKWQCAGRGHVCVDGCGCWSDAGGQVRGRAGARVGVAHAACSSGGGGSPAPKARGRIDPAVVR